VYVAIIVVAVGESGERGRRTNTHKEKEMKRTTYQHAVCGLRKQADEALIVFILPVLCFFLMTFCACRLLDSHKKRSSISSTIANSRDLRVMRDGFETSRKNSTSKFVK